MKSEYNIFIAHVKTRLYVFILNDSSPAVIIPNLQLSWPGNRYPNHDSYPKQFIDT